MMSSCHDPYGKGPAENLGEISNSDESCTCTVECRYNAVLCCKMLRKILQELRQNFNQMLDPQKTPHTSFLWASYGVSFAYICEKTDGVITAPHCIWNLRHIKELNKKAN